MDYIYHSLIILHLVVMTHNIQWMIVHRMKDIILESKNMVMKT